MAEFVFADVLHDGRPFVHLDVARKLRSLRGNHNAEITAARVSLPDEFCHFVDVERHFGNQDDVCSARYAAVDGDPTRVASHDLDHDYAIVRLGGSVHAVNSAGGYVDRCVETKGEVGAGE